MFSLKKKKKYACFRRGFSGDEADTRCVWFGLDWWLEKYLEPAWDPSKDVEGAAAFFETHLAALRAGRTRSRKRSCSGPCGRRGATSL